MAGESDKNVQIEILRAVAIVYTLIHHLPMVSGYVPKSLNWLYQNASFHTGVDLFLVISGFVITRSLCNATTEFPVSKWRMMGAFWLKRIFRLLPLAWLWLVITALYTLAFADSLGAGEQTEHLLTPILASLLQVANLHSAYCMADLGKGVSCEVTNLSAHYWSLSLEEQFYMLYPFLFFLANRKLLVVVLCIAVAAQFFWLRPIFSYGWYFRTDGLIWGVLLGFFANTRLYASSVHWLSSYSGALSAMMILLIILLPIIGIRVEAWGSEKSYGVGVIALVSACIVLIASYDVKCFGSAGGALQKVMLYLGVRSYSLYVTHFTLFSMMGFAGKQILSGRTLGPGVSVVFYASLAILALLLTFVASELSYRYVESRFRPRGRQLARQLLMKVR